MRTLDDIAAFLHTDFARAVAARGVPGASIAVLKDGEIIEAVAGILSTSTRVEATTDSVFQIGSITKLWTATLVMQLVDDGLLDLDAPIRDYLPTFRLADEGSAAAITTRQLLSHQAGFEGDVFTDTGRGDDAVEKFLEVVADLPQLFPPGALFSYNNVGFCVLGRLVEVLREQPWETALVERIAVPLGLTHVAPSAYEAILFRAAVGHIGVDDDGVAIAAPVWALARSNEPAGSMLAMRARDLLGFAKMHLADGAGPDGVRVLSEESARAMRGKHIALPQLTAMGDAWALGWEIMQEAGPTVIGHDGGTIGQSAFLRVLPETGLAVAMLTNGGDIMGLFDDVVAHILQESAGVVHRPHATPPAEPVTVDVDPFLGRYADSIYDMALSVDGDGRIWLDRTPKAVLVELGEKPDRTELVGFGPDHLIALEPTKGLHFLYAFLGDNGVGRRQYMHYGRVIARAD